MKSGEYFLQDCQTHRNLRAELWRADTAVTEVYGHVENLQCHICPSYHSFYLSQR